MKKLLSIIILSFFILKQGKNANAQGTYTYGNEWINPSQSYWKFYISANRIYKLDYNKILELGLGNIPGNQFQLFNQGIEVPLYVTTSGIFGPSDYILFEGKRRDMGFDKQMFTNPEMAFELVPVTYRANPYFLTYKTNGETLRFTKVNNPNNTSAPAITNFMFLNSTYLEGSQAFNTGRSYSSTNHYPSSNYDINEGYIASSSSTAQRNYTISNINKYDGDSLEVYFSIYNAHAGVNNNLRAILDGITILDTIATPNAIIKKRLKIPNTSLANGNITLSFIGSTNFIINEMIANSSKTPNFASVEVSYSNLFIPNINNYFAFTQPYVNPTTRISFLDKTNLEFYDITTISNTNHRVTFNPSSENRNVIFFRNDLIVNFTGLITPVNFDFDINSLNKNYLILSDSFYINASPNNIQKYVNYRNSANGGSYQAVAIDVNKLYDLFAYGHQFHPLAIKNFVKYALDNWQTKPEYLFIVGKGLQPQLYTSYMANPSAYNFKPIPTWGHPGTDNLLTSYSTNGKTFPELATGRLSIQTNEEIGVYLEKVKQYEEEVKISPSIKSAIWKKEVLHIAGGADQVLQNSLIADLNRAKTIIEDTLLNGRVTTVYKRSTDPMTNNADRKIDSLIESGVRYITFYGHASSSGFDYNLNSPEVQRSKPRFSIFSAYGCDVADIYLLTNTKTISENYLLAANGGSIAMIASNNLGWTSIIPVHMQGLYRQFASTSYYKTLGEQYKANVHYLNNNFINEFYNIHSQSFLLQGDPGLLLGNPSQADLAIEEQNVAITPASINVTTGEFKVNAKFYNIGLSTKDSFWVKTTHSKINNGQVLFVDSFKTNVGLLDSFTLNIPLTDQAVGLTRVNIQLDIEDTIQEIYESNNEINIDVNIYDEGLIPVYPYEFAIVNEPTVELKASTLNTMAPFNKYIIEFDTTELFNSPLKQSHQIATIGGTIKWKPNGTLIDSTVYYWRTAIDTLINGERNWNYSSFINIQDGYPGWNQSHYYQQLKDQNIGIELGNNRKYAFSPYIKKYTSTNLTVYNGAITRQFEVTDALDGATLNIFSCWFGYNTIQIGVLDSLTGEPVARSVYCSQARMQTMNEFHVNTPANRNNAMNFLRNIPAGYYITVKTIVFSGNYNAATMSPAAWQNDTATYGSGNSLYHALKELGFTDIDQTNTTSRKTFLFFTKKGEPNYQATQKVSNGDEKIYIDVPITTYVDHGRVNSTILGPAEKWETFHWQPQTLDNAPQNDTSYVMIYGLNNAENETLLYTGIARDTSLSFINATTYPKIRLSWLTYDTLTNTSQHLNYWRVHYQPLPEAALNPISLFNVVSDTLGYGENLSFKIAVENISDLDMDSMLVRYRVVDQSNVSHELESKRFKPLAKGDTVDVGLDIDIRNYAGLNYLIVEANPFSDQPELFHPNNIGTFPFYVHTDNRNPLLDVTFDGIRILDKDIVSAKPFIKILLNDENKNLLLKDTSLFEVHLAPPNNISNPIRVPIDGTICKFYPAVDAENNEAYLEYRPNLEENGIYKLIVKAKDNSGNIAGNFDKYEVNFTVDNTPGISHMLNYPNPFSTSTAFIFTLTGHQIPSQLKIQILSVTGKVVREITKEELGPINIGRNITQYKWDGRDQFGQLLGNGVYLYRVVTHNNGEKLKHRANKNVDQYFKNGYGKMYIMR